MVVHVVQEPVGDRRLRRGGLERRVRVDHPGGGVEARVGDAPDGRPCRCCSARSRAASRSCRRCRCSRRCPRRRFVTALCGRMLTNSPSDMKRPAHVLEDEDVAVALEVGSVGPSWSCSDRRRRAPRSRACGSAGSGSGFGGVVRHVDRGEELDPVAHRDAVLDTWCSCERMYAARSSSAVCSLAPHTAHTPAATTTPTTSPVNGARLIATPPFPEPILTRLRPSGTRGACKPTIASSQRSARSISDAQTAPVATADHDRHRQIVHDLTGIPLVGLE